MDLLSSSIYSVLLWYEAGAAGTEPMHRHQIWDIHTRNQGDFQSACSFRCKYPLYLLIVQLNLGRQSWIFLGNVFIWKKISVSWAVCFISVDPTLWSANFNWCLAIHWEYLRTCTRSLGGFYLILLACSSWRLLRYIHIPKQVTISQDDWLNREIHGKRIDS